MYKNLGAEGIGNLSSSIREPSTTQKVVNITDRTKESTSELTSKGEKITVENFEQYLGKYVCVHNSNSNHWEQSGYLISVEGEEYIIYSDLASYQTYLANNEGNPPSPNDIQNLPGYENNINCIPVLDKNIYCKPSFHITY